MSASRSRRLRGAPLAFFWGGLFYLLFQLTGAVLVEHWLPGARDPEFAVKVRHLQDRLDEAPGSPLVIMLGSSRTALGFKAGAVHVSQNSKSPVVFNFGLSGGGAGVELLCRARLPARGTPPRP